MLSGRIGFITARSAIFYRKRATAALPRVEERAKADEIG